MAEPPAATASEVPGPELSGPELSGPELSGPELSGRSALLSTKLHPPRPRPDFLPRPRLAERLDEATRRGLVLVCAPAGYGKTSLLASWARHSQQPVAWLSLDASDNNPARFWRHAVAALDAVCPGIGERVGPLLGPPAPQSFEGLVTALINELAARSGPSDVPLVLDDYHLVGSQPVHASLGFLLDHLPPGLHPVLASRADPPFALARLRARGQLLPLDEMRGWWRYHQLFADLLRARLEQQPDRAGQLHRNAAVWYADHELADDAIAHAVAAGEMTWDARLIEEHFDERFYLHGEVSTVRRWLDAL